MANNRHLFIIGNGFDLSHGLKTSYKDFFEDVVNSHFNKSSKYPTFFSTSLLVENLEQFKENASSHQYINKFFGLLTEDFVNKNWCDIEEVYFSQLKSSKVFKSIQDLNADFEEVKSALETYLSQLPKSIINHNYYEQVFNPPTLGSKLILNFNYTNTAYQYNNAKKSEMINIHGELNNDSNPIIFGYAATDKEMSVFRRKNNEYMRYIKRTNYAWTDNFAKLKKFINRSSPISVSILGHSCGQSDKLILSTIFNNSHVQRIEIVYYNKNTYFDKNVNIQKLVKTPTIMDKLVSFQNSLRMPQLVEDKSYEELLTDYYQNFGNVS